MVKYRDEVRRTLDAVSDQEEWEADYVIEYPVDHDYALPLAIDCIVYYVTGSKMKTRVLRLYKDLLRYGQNLQFTDKKYFKYRIKKSFLENQNLDDVKAIEFCIQKGQKALDSRRVV